MHPIFEDSTETENQVDENGNLVDENGNIITPEEKPLNPEDYDTFVDYENKQYGLFFEHPKDVEVSTSTKNEDGMDMFSVQNKGGLLPLGFEVTVTNEKIDGEPDTQLTKFFAIATDRLEEENGSYKTIVDKEEETNFVGQKFLVRKYKVSDKVQDYFVTYAVTVVGESTYAFKVTHPEQDSLDAEMIYKSSNLGDGLTSTEDKDTEGSPVAVVPTATTTPATTTPTTNESCDIKGVKDSKTYYMPSSSKYEEAKADLVFCTEESAQKSGYKNSEE
jgi:hypothetical protein